MIRSGHGAGHSRLALALLASFVLAGCRGGGGAYTILTPGSGGAVFGTPPTVAAFCPSPAQLKPIIHVDVIPDDGTQTFANATDCNYTTTPPSKRPSAQCAFTSDAFSAVPQAEDWYKSEYEATQSDDVQITGLGDAAFWNSGDQNVAVRKGVYVLSDKCYFLPPKSDAESKQIDERIAILLLSKL
jgi:hypothetical protein